VHLHRLHWSRFHWRCIYSLITLEEVLFLYSGYFVLYSYDVYIISSANGNRRSLSLELLAATKVRLVTVRLR
jgi:hypothetical protein